MVKLKPGFPVQLLPFRCQRAGSRFPDMDLRDAIQKIALE